MHRTKDLLRTFFLFACVFFSIAQSQRSDAELQRSAIYQRSTDARSRLNVLSVSIEPGQEDLATLAYFRMAKGAKILSAYVTNGEGGENEGWAENPLSLAVTRRNEAIQALALVDGNVHFLNLPDVVAAPDSASVQSRWPVDTLDARLKKLILEYHPDIVLLARDGASATSVRWKLFRESLIRTVKKIVPPQPSGKNRRASSSGGWVVGRVWVESSAGTGVSVPDRKSVV